MKKYPEGFVLFAGGSENIEDAKEYIKSMGFNSQNVRILANDEEVLVITKLPVTIENV